MAHSLETRYITAYLPVGSDIWNSIALFEGPQASFTLLSDKSSVIKRKLRAEQWSSVRERAK